MEIKHYDAICNTPALRLAVRGWHELLEMDSCPGGGVLIGYDHKSIVAFDDDGGEPIGVLTWINQDWANQLYVMLAYVVPGHRRKGVHTAMWRALVEKAGELKRPAIASGTSSTNAISRAVMASQGRAEAGVYTRYIAPVP
jgi:RimJ/RimL family protein N-acetyltransferase